MKSRAQQVGEITYYQAYYRSAPAPAVSDRPKAGVCGVVLMVGWQASCNLGWIVVSAEQQFSARKLDAGKLGSQRNGQGYLRLY